MVVKWLLSIEVGGMGQYMQSNLFPNQKLLQQPVIQSPFEYLHGLRAHYHLQQFIKSSFLSWIWFPGFRLVFWTDTEQVNTLHYVSSQLSLYISLSRSWRSSFHPLVFTSAVWASRIQPTLSLVTCFLNTLYFVYVSLKMWQLEPNKHSRFSLNRRELNQAVF